MFKGTYFPPSFLKNMNCQGKGCYGKETFKAVAVLVDIEPNGTMREEISQQISTNNQERQNPHIRTVRIP